jgi:uncharacterized membrane protein YidH (DUF202 family)
LPEKSLPTLATELWELVRDYAKQQLVEPVKGLGRAVGFGLAGAFLVGAGLVLLAIALLRVLQTETGDHLQGNLTWIPYLIVLVVSGLVLALFVSLMAKRKGSSR